MGKGFEAGATAYVVAFRWSSPMRWSRMGGNELQRKWRSACAAQWTNVRVLFSIY